jgi:Tfp pilus assembly protein PilF
VELTRDFRDVEKRYRVGTILMEYGSPEEAAVWLRTALEIDPRHEPSHRALFDYYSRIGDEAQAARHRRFLTSDTQSPPPGDAT